METTWTISRITGHVDPSTHFSGNHVNQDLVPFANEVVVTDSL